MGSRYVLVSYSINEAETVIRGLNALPALGDASGPELATVTRAIHKTTTALGRPHARKPAEWSEGVTPPGVERVIVTPDGERVIGAGSCRVAHPDLEFVRCGMAANHVGPIHMAGGIEWPVDE